MTRDRAAMLELRHAFDGLRAAWNGQAPTADIHEHFARTDAAIEALATAPSPRPFCGARCWNGDFCSASCRVRAVLRRIAEQESAAAVAQPSQPPCERAETPVAADASTP